MSKKDKDCTIVRSVAIFTGAPLRVRTQKPYFSCEVRTEPRIARYRTRSQSNSIATPLNPTNHAFDMTRRDAMRLRTLKGGPAQEKPERNASEWIPLLRGPC